MYNYKMCTCPYTERTVGSPATFVCMIPEEVMVNTLNWKFFPSNGGPRKNVPIGGRYTHFTSCTPKCTCMRMSITCRVIIAESAIVL